MKGRIVLWLYTIAVTIIAAMLALTDLRGWMLALLAENWHPPQTVTGFVDSDWLDRTDSTSQKFTALLEQKFPAGTEESRVKSDLFGAGFKPVSPVGRADCQQPMQIEQKIGWASVSCEIPFNFVEYRWANGIVCGHSLIVQWSTEDDRVAHIRGHYSSHCL